MKLSKTDNVAFLTAEGSRTLITFLWEHYSVRIIIYLGIPYLIYFVMFLLNVFYSESFLLNSVEGKYRYDSPANEIGNYIIFAINLAFIAYFVYVLIRRITYMHWSIFNSIWAYLDIVSLSLNVTIIGMILAEKDIRRLR